MCRGADSHACALVNMNSREFLVFDFWPFFFKAFPPFFLFLPDASSGGGQPLTKFPSVCMLPAQLTFDLARRKEMYINWFGSSYFVVWDGTFFKRLVEGLFHAARVGHIRWNGRAFYFIVHEKYFLTTNFMQKEHFKPFPCVVSTFFLM